MANAGKAEAGSYDESDYMPCSERDIEEMYDELLKIMSKVQNEHLKSLINSFFVEDKEFIGNFKKHSAAKRVHHGFIGGLLEHTLGVVKYVIILQTIIHISARTYCLRQHFSMT